jgi:hypothetical protein
MLKFAMGLVLEEEYNYFLDRLCEELEIFDKESVEKELFDIAER